MLQGLFPPLKFVQLPAAAAPGDHGQDRLVPRKGEDQPPKGARQARARQALWCPGRRDASTASLVH